MDDEGYVVKDSLFWTSPLPQIDQHMLTPFAINTRTKKAIRTAEEDAGDDHSNGVTAGESFGWKKDARMQEAGTTR